jgi:predicted RND superfamily exporter protein
MLLERAVNWLLRLRAPLLVACIVTAALAYGPSRRLEFDRSVEGLFHKDDPRLVNYREDKALFGGAETSLVAFSDPKLLTADGLARLEQLDAALRSIPGVQNVISLAQARLPGSPLSSKTLRDHLADGGLTPQQLRADLLASDLYRGRVLSTDGSTTLLLVSLAPVESNTPPRDETIGKIREACAAHNPPAVVAGGPVLIEEVYGQLETDGRMLGVASTIVLAAVMAFLFRNLRWIALPLAVVQLTIVWTKALLVLGGGRLSMVSSPLVALVTVIGVATVMHLAIRFREERDLHPPEASLRNTLVQLGPAIFWTSLTTAAGFASLLACRIVPVGEFGTMMALGSMLVFVATMGLLPGGVLIGRVHTDPAPAPAERHLTAALDHILAVVNRYPGRVAAVGVGFLIFTALGIMRLEVATDFDENFRQSSRIVRSFRFISERMGTIATFDVLVDAPPPGEPQKFNQFLDDLRALQKDLAAVPNVTGTMSITNLLDFAMSTEKDRAGTMELVTANLLERAGPVQRLVALQALQPALVSAFWNRDHNVVRIVVQTAQTRGAKPKRDLIESVESAARKRFPSARTAGVEILLTYSVQSLLSDQWTTFGLSVSAIVIMMWIAFRDWRLGLIALVPNAMPILIVVGVMGWAGLKVNMATAMLSSVSMGMTVDFSIHYLYRYRQERTAGKSLGEALVAAHSSVGLAMVLADVALIAGFSTLTLSAFVPTVHFGILVSIAMLGGLIGNLTTLPLLLRFVGR